MGVMRYGSEANPWLGDHSFSWLTLDELLNWDGWDQLVNDNGIIGRERYENWDGKSQPFPRSGDIRGAGVIKADQRTLPEANPDWTHVRVYWSEPLREYCGSFLKWLEYAETKAWMPEARIVFGFDS